VEPTRRATAAATRSFQVVRSPRQARGCRSARINTIPNTRTRCLADASRWTVRSENLRELDHRSFARSAISRSSLSCLARPHILTPSTRTSYNVTIVASRSFHISAVVALRAAVPSVANVGDAPQPRWWCLQWRRCGRGCHGSRSLPCAASDVIISSTSHTRERARASRRRAMLMRAAARCSWPTRRCSPCCS